MESSAGNGSVAEAQGDAEAHTDSVAGEPQAFRAVGFLLSSLGHAVAGSFSARLAPLGLEPREFALLRAIGSGAGDSQQAAGERLGIPASRMVALVDDLEGRRLLERRPSPRDRRAHALHLTPSGKRLLAKAIGVAAGLEGELTGDLDPAERAQLVELLDRVAVQLGVPTGVHGSQVVH
jgi:DNA-binding MarR family transcriptional regulator